VAYSSTLVIHASNAYIYFIDFGTHHKKKQLTNINDGFIDHNFKIGKKKHILIPELSKKTNRPLNFCLFQVSP
jgi:hypothetical protein